MAGSVAELRAKGASTVILVTSDGMGVAENCNMNS